MPPLPRRLHARLALLGAAAVATTLAVFSLYITDEQMEFAEKAVARDAMSLAEALANGGSDYFADGDFVRIERDFRQAAHREAVLSLAYADADGRVRVHVRRNASGDILTVVADGDSLAVPSRPEHITSLQGDRAVAWHPIDVAARRGWVRTELSSAEYEAVRNHIWRDTVVSTLLAILGSALLFAAFLRRPMRDIRRAAAFAAQLDHGQGAQLTRDTSAEEIEQLVASLNEASAKLHQQGEELQLAASVYQASGEAMFVTDADNRILAVNPAFTRLTGYAPHEVIGLDPKLLGSERNDETVFIAMWQALQARGQWQGEVWNRRKNGEEYAEWLTITSIRNERGELHRRVALFSDITQKKQAEELIWQQANYDTLTGLPNRRLFRDRLKQELRRAQRSRKELALLFIDLDHFKEVNDALGHDAGDRLLSEAAQRIVGCVRETDTVARLGGDEFTVTLPGLADPAAVERVAQAIVQELEEPFTLNGEIAYVSASVGITVFPDDAQDMETLLKNADQAMYAAKEAGRNGYSWFTPAMQHAARTRRNLVRDLRTALAAGQFEVHYQPIVALPEGNIVKAEALLRWHHPVHGMVSPTVFIPLAEEVGLIREIGNWVFRTVATQARAWCEAGLGLQISINKSPRQFAVGNSHEEWLDHLQEIGLPAKCLIVEITEGLLLDERPEVAERLRCFRRAGVQIAIDDFGTGYSALSYLQKFDIDYVKIDRSFILDLTTDSNDRALADAIVVMAHKLGLKVVAEGVETAQQRDYLAAVGCDYAQGFLYAEPLPAAQFEKLMRTPRAVAATAAAA